MDLNVKVKEDDGKDYARCQIGTDEGSVTVEGKSAFVVQVLKDILSMETGLIHDAMVEGVSEFESKEQIEAVFNKALADAGLTVNEPASPAV